MLKTISLTILTLLSTLVHASLEDHFKPALNKASGHTMSNIDFIYMINLDERPEKWKMSNDQLNPYGIYPYRFSAVNGWKLTLEQINDVGVKYAPGMQGGFMATTYPLDENLKLNHETISTYGKVYFCHCMARGPIGISLSHLSILQDAYDSGYETIWVMEDDIEVVSDPNRISSLVKKLERVTNGNWDILFTDQDTRGSNGNYVPCFSAARKPNFNPKNPNDYAKRVDVNTYFRKIGARYGAYSLIYSRRGIERVLNFIKTHKIFLPFDMEFNLSPGMKIYSVRKDLIRHRSGAISDNGGENYL